MPPYRRYLGLTFGTPEKLGELSGQTATASRGMLLASLINSGKLKVTDLSSNDMALAGPRMGDTGERNVSAPNVGGAFSNLGSDIWGATKGLFPGLFNAGKAVVEDIPTLFNPVNLAKGFTNPLSKPPETHIKKDILDPIVESYKYTYGGKGTDESFLQRLYEHPLGPILDAATVASLGAGGAIRGAQALSKAGRISPENALVRAGSTEGRAPLSFGEAKGGDFEVPDISRNYSTRPLRKGLQVLTDKSTGLPMVGPKIEDLQRRFTRGHEQKTEYSAKENQVLGNINREVAEPLVPLLKDLAPAEVEAFGLIGHGINNPALLDLYQESVARGLKNENLKGQNIQDYEGSVEPGLAETRANIPEDVKDLVVNPEKSPALMAAMTKYQDIVNERVRPGLEDEQFSERANAVRNELMKDIGGDLPATPPDQMHRWDYNKLKKAGTDEGIYVEDLLSGEGPNLPEATTGPSRGDYPFEPTLMPSEPARGFKWNEPGAIAKTLTGREGAFTRGKSGTFNPTNLTYQNLFQEPNLSFRPKPEATLAGVQRPDARSFVDFLAKHERDKVEKAYSEESINRVALKDENGEMVQVPGSMSPSQVRDKFGDNWVPVSPTYPLHWYNKEVSVADAIGQMEDMGYGVDSSEVAARMGAEAEDMALDATVGARRMPAVLVPRDFAEYQRKLETASEPYNNKFFRGYARVMNTWRTWTLAMMPRWAVNTAVGSFALTTVKGVGGKHYLSAASLKRAGAFEKDELAGVNLGATHAMELLESGAQGYMDQAFGVKVGPGSRKIMQKVQGIEDYFRRASFVQSLDHQSQRLMNESGAIIRNVEESKGPRTTDEYIDFIMENPEAVRRAIDDVNRFSYNFAALGPFERRYVRQAIPFWGWYKFISGFAYRLPVDYPGRANVLAQIGALGSEQTQEKYGAMPPWMAGALPFGMGKNFKYLSTMGLNPVSQIFNPLGREGLAAGSLQLGQGSPLIQSLMLSYGIDPLRGGEVPFSPETANVERDFLGRLVNTDTGEEVDIHQVAPGRRFLGSLLRSFPQVRIGERVASGGRSVYPESVPLLAERYMPTKPESQFGGSVAQALEQMVGFAPKTYNLEDYQRLMKKSAKYARTRRKSRLRKANK